MVVQIVYLDQWLVEKERRGYRMIASVSSALIGCVYSVWIVRLLI